MSSPPRPKLPSVAVPADPVPHVTRLGRGDTRSNPSLRDDGENVPAGAYDGLPGLIVELAEVAGLHAALALATARGGNRVYIPAKAADDHWLVTTVGRIAADKIMGYYTSGVELDLPRGPTGLRATTWRRLYRMLDEGCSSTQITRALGISRDTVKYHRAKMRTTAVTAQMSLFALLETGED
jgi:DNA-binding NarL/FixJ family response regulator